MKDPYIQVGKRFSLLILLEDAVSSAGYVLCRCDCGNEKRVQAKKIKFGHTKSCGCMAGRRMNEIPYLIAGSKFGRLAVLDNVLRSDDYAVCQCNCGNTVKVQAISLKNGNTKSCGCLRRELSRARRRTHGLSGHYLYRTWSSMITRCTVDSHPSYENYGARGIDVCDRWRGDSGFVNFLSDMGDKPSDEYSLGRLNNDRGYYPDNCEWQTKEQQAHNKRHLIKNNDYGALVVENTKLREEVKQLRQLLRDKGVVLWQL